MSIKKIALLFFPADLLIMAGCKSLSGKEEIKAGSICTIEGGEGKHGIVKVLVINDEEAHVKIYRNKYDHVLKKLIFRH